MLSHSRGHGRDRLGGVIAPRTAAALAQAALAGPYFAITLAPDELLWRPFSDLLEPAVLTENVDQVRRVLHERTHLPMADLDLRACASTHALGLTARLVAPALAAAALAGHMPTFAVDDLRWQRVAGGPVPTGLAAAGGDDVDDVDDAAAALHANVIEAAVAPLVEAFQATFALSLQVLWGNVASALAGSATMIVRTGTPTCLDPRQLAARTTAQGALEGMGTWANQRFTRNNCCLFYKIPGGGKCGDCVLISNDLLE
jgi:ferric iron reductase protein FhuF